MGLALEIYRVCREAVAGQRGRLEWVRVAVGELAAVEPDLLVFAWEAAVSGGPDAGARLELEWCAARQHCPSCGEIGERAAGSWLRLCPGCQGPLRVEGGDELDVLQLCFTPEEGAGAGD
jgi:Zn finger protein HypA/HybF involved in hydrogenase expression